MQNNQIAIVHGTASSLSEITDITFRNHADYALKHGYLMQEFTLDPPHTGDKLWALYQTLENDNIRRAFWINSNAVFTNLELSLAEHLPNDPVVIACDIFGPSADCLWVENSPEVRRLLWAASRVGAWIFEGHHPGTVDFSEQMGLRYLSLHPPYQHLFTYVDQRVMKSHYNQYCLDGRPEDSFGQWQPGDFILSLAGITESFQEAILEKVLPTK